MQKFWKKNKKGLAVNRRGLTLIEVVMAIAVLSITILASTAVSATYLNGRVKIKKYQANNEELSIALNSMSKDIRMSNSLAALSDGFTSSVVLKSNVNDNSIVYNFDSSGRKLTRSENGGAVVDIVSKVTGNFYIRNFSGIPRITIIIKKEGIPGMTVQTTVSMRSGYEPAP